MVADCCGLLPRPRVTTCGPANRPAPGTPHNHHATIVCFHSFSRPCSSCQTNTYAAAMGYRPTSAPITRPCATSSGMTMRSTPCPRSLASPRGNFAVVSNQSSSRRQQHRNRAPGIQSCSQSGEVAAALQYLACVSPPPVATPSPECSLPVPCSVTGNC